MVYQTTKASNTILFHFIVRNGYCCSINLLMAETPELLSQNNFYLSRDILKWALLRPIILSHCGFHFSYSWTSNFNPPLPSWFPISLFTCTSVARVSYVSLRQCQFCRPRVSATPGRLKAQCLAISVSTVWARAGSVIERYWSNSCCGMTFCRYSKTLESVMTKKEQGYTVRRYLIIYIWADQYHQWGVDWYSQDVWVQCLLTWILGLSSDTGLCAESSFPSSSTLSISSDSCGGYKYAHTDH